MMREWKKERMVLMTKLVEAGINTYEELAKLPIYQSVYKVDGDRMDLQKVGIMDIEGRNFHTLVLIRPTTREELDKLFPTPKGKGIGCGIDMDEYWELGVS